LVPTQNSQTAEKPLDFLIDCIRVTGQWEVVFALEFNIPCARDVLRNIPSMSNINKGVLRPMKD
jgi:hypothetical protein